MLTVPLVSPTKYPQKDLEGILNGLMLVMGCSVETIKHGLPCWRLSGLREVIGPNKKFTAHRQVKIVYHLVHAGNSYGYVVAKNIDRVRRKSHQGFLCVPKHPKHLRMRKV